MYNTFDLSFVISKDYNYKIQNLVTLVHTT